MRSNASNVITHKRRQQNNRIITNNTELSMNTMNRTNPILTIIVSTTENGSNLLLDSIKLSIKSLYDLNSEIFDHI